MNNAPKDRWLLYVALCLLVVSIGYVWRRVNGTSSAKTCPAGQALDANGNCSVPLPPPCSEGQVRDANGTCIVPPPPPCPEGQVRDARGKCSFPQITQVDPPIPRVAGRFDLTVMMGGRPVEEGEKFYYATSVELLSPSWSVNASRARANAPLKVVWFRGEDPIYESDEMRIRPRLEGKPRGLLLPGSYQVKLMAGERELAVHRFVIEKGAAPEPTDKQ